MIDGAIAVLRLQKSNGIETQLLFGDLPKEVTPAVLADSCTEKPGLRKIGARLCVALPEQLKEQTPSWVVWLFDHVPEVTELPGLMDRIKKLSAGIAAPPENPNTEHKVETVPLMLAQLNGATRQNSAAVLQLAADSCVAAGFCEKAVVAHLRAGKVKQISLSDQALAPIADEIRYLMRSRLKDIAHCDVIEGGDFGEDAFDLVLLAEMSQSKSLLLNLPGRREDGFAFLLFGPDNTAKAETEALRDLLSVVLKPRKTLSSRGKRNRYGILAAAFALFIWLLMPAPVMVTATATSHPAYAQALALPFEVFLQDMYVQVGDRVTKGSLIAEFRSPLLEERREEMLLQTETERIAAQAALAENDYGAYVIAEQRIATNERQLQHIEERLEGLRVIAPEGGRIISALGQEIIGAFVPPGESIAVVQPEARFILRLIVSRVDAPLLQPGQTGEVWFRGISGQTWPLTVTAPGQHEVSPETGDEQLVFYARLNGENQEDLFVGLAGFANIETGRAMRAKVLGRYVIEYLRMKAWTWFDLQF